MKKVLLFFILSFVFILNADDLKKGEITGDMLVSFENSLPKSGEFKSLSMALKNCSIQELFLNREALKDHNNKYTYEIKVPGITNQKSTGRCWMYAGYNVIRPKIAKKLNLKSFEFSTNYLFFYDKLEKANSFFERVIENSDLNIRDYKYRSLLSSPVGDGGYWQNFVDLVKKYGLVPKSAMEEVNSTKKSSGLNRSLTWLLRNYAYKLREMKKSGQTIEELREAKKDYLSKVYKILVMHLGEPVKNFSFRYNKKDKKGKLHLTPYKEYTPKSFFKEFLKEDLDNYIMFANWPAREYGKYYQWQYSSNINNGIKLNFINLEMDKIKKMMIASIKAGVPVNFSADVGKMMDRKRGIMEANLYKVPQAYGVDFSYDKKKNTVIGNINSTHAMVIQGVDIKDNKPLKWKVENSWGVKAGDKGFYAMYDNWLDLYVVRIVIHKDFIPKDVLDILKTKPIVIPAIEPEQ